MGQRSQIYIRYNGGKSLVAMHLQWNWGRYMINRTYQLLKFISENLKIDYSNFTSENFDTINRGNTRQDIRILQSLIQINLTCASWVGGIDLVEEEKEYMKEASSTFRIEPEKQDNNNGILVIDISDDKKIKYGLTVGYEAEGNYKEFEIISARKYMEAYQGDLNYIKENCKTDEDKKEYLELIAEIEKQLIFTEDFEVLEQAEYRAIFEKQYNFEDCGIKEESPLF